MSWFQWKLKRLHIPYQKRRVKFRTTQLDGPGMVSSANVPEILTEDRVCDTVIPEASFTELLMNVEEASLIREESNRTSNDAGAVLDQEFAFRFADPASILDTQGSAGSDQGAQGTGSPPSSSVLVQNITTAADHWTLRSTSLVNHSEDVHEGGVQPPNVSHSRSTVNASAGTSLSNNSMGHSPRLHVPSFNDICDHELEKLSREQGTLKKTFEETTSELMAELERKMAEARSDYDKKYQEVDAAYNAQAKKNEALRSLVTMNSLLANAYKSTCPVKSAATDTSTVRSKARSSQHSTHTHVNSTAPPRPLVTAAEATPPNLLTARSSQHSTAPQQQAVQTNTHMNSAAPPRPSVTAAEATPPNLSAARSSQHSTTQQQQAVQTNTHMNSTAPPRPSVTAAAATPPNLSAPIPRCNTPQPRPIPQQALVQANTDINSTALPQPSVTEEAPPLHQPSSKTPQPKPISQLPAIQSNTDINSTPLPQPSVTSKAISLHSPPCNTPQPRPPPLISNHTPTSYQAASAPPVPGIVRRTMAPHLRSSRAPNSAAAPSTYPRLVQGQQQQQENSNSGLVYLSDDD